MNTFLNWFNRNRVAIGYTIGALNLFTAGYNYAIGETLNALSFFVLGMVLTFDAVDSK